VEKSVAFENNTTPILVQGYRRYPLLKPDLNGGGAGWGGGIIHANMTPETQHAFIPPISKKPRLFENGHRKNRIKLIWS